MISKSNELDHGKEVMSGVYGF